MPISIRIKRGTGGQPASLLRGELAYDETNQKLYIGSGDSGSADANGLPIATSVVELTTPPTVLADLADISVGSGASDGDVLVYDSSTSEWVAEALSIAWDDVTSKPASFTPSTHASSHHTGGGDAIAPADIGAAASNHTHSDATTSVAGFMSAADKTKLDGVASGATANTGTVTSVVGGTGLTGGTITATGTLAVSYGTTAGTACEGNDARLSDSRTPTSHTHSASDIISGLATVATTGAYSDLTGTPTLGTAAASATSDFVAASAASTFGLSLLDDANAAAARTTLGLGSAATLASTAFADTDHSHDWTDITSGVPSTFTPSSHTHGNISNDGKIGTTAGHLVKTGSDGTLTTLGLGFTDQYLKTGVSGPEWASLPSTFAPSAHNHTIKQELSGFIEAPEAKTYVLSPSTNAAMTITQLKAQTSAGTVDVKIQDDGVDVTGATLADAGTTLASLASDISVSVAAGSKLALVVSDLQSSPADLAFSVHYTVASANNA